MVTVFCRVTAEISSEFIQKFSAEFDINSMLSIICRDNNLEISYQDQNIIIHGDWGRLGSARDMLISALAIYGSPSERKTESLGLRPFSALVEAAEAISREVELQEKVENEAELLTYHSSSNATSIQNIPLEDKTDVIDDITDEDYVKEELNLKVYGECSLESDSQSDSLSACSSTLGTIPLQKDAELSDASNMPSLSRKEYVALHGNSGEYILQNEGKNVNKHSFRKKTIARDVNVSHSFVKERPAGLLTCDECEKVFKNKKTFTTHLKTHNQFKEISSVKNGTVEKSDGYKNKNPCNVKNTSEKRMFLCQKCGKSMSTKQSLIEHINAHLGIKPYQCSECGKAFSYEAALRDHRHTHNDIKQYVCQYPKCEKAFRQRSSLRAHEKIHEETKQYSCSECGHGFSQRQALLRHERSHKGLKPFKCKLCGRRFGDTSIAKRHVRLVHKLNRENVTWREDIEEVADETELDSKPTANEETANNEQTNSTTDEIVGKSMKKDCDDTLSNHVNTDATSTIPNAQQSVPASTHNIQTVFVNYDLPEQTIVSNSNHGFQEVVAVPLHTKVDRHENIKAPTNNLPFLQPEHENYVIERDQIHFLTENLDGTINTSTIDFSRLKRNSEPVTKPNTSLDISIVSDQLGETLKPDGTVAELPVDNSFEHDQLSEHLGLSLPQFQFYSSNSVNQYLI
ncbi:hypothetical protein ACF0H5_010512 [Mactra antiquata]